ncbi:hypothetical protein BS17DRAFT_551825 [Gyrodon lividus]|nr:hypothetical protein BS17DRAFT_551825 [Gyrodon lividus]
MLMDSGPGQQRLTLQRLHEGRHGFEGPTLDAIARMTSLGPHQLIDVFEHTEEDRSRGASSARVARNAGLS